MKKKSDTQKVIIRAVAHLQLLCGRKVKRLHSGSADEQDTSDIKDFLGKVGTERTFTAPGYSPSNAIVERRFWNPLSPTRELLFNTHHPHLTSTSSCHWPRLTLLTKRIIYLYGAMTSYSHRRTLPGKYTALLQTRSAERTGFCRVGNLDSS